MRGATVRTDLRPELEQPLPLRMERLPVHRGYPVPWFVEWIANGEAVPIGRGEPDFRVMSRDRFDQALAFGLCWVCGGKLGAHRAFTIGPMCAVNRTSAEPPSHRECAEWSARNCPFLSRPRMRRREAGRVEGTQAAPGIALMRNPGVALVWVTKTYAELPTGGGVLLKIGAPEETSWWAEGREATRAEILASIESGLPSLRELAEQDGPAALRELEHYVDRAMALLPVPLDGVHPDPSPTERTRASEAPPQSKTENP